jgi:hypothetical protein
MALDYQTINAEAVYWTRHAKGGKNSCGGKGSKGGKNSCGGKGGRGGKKGK